MYAQWRSVEDYQAMRQDRAPLPFLQEVLAIATFEPGMYEVVQTFAPLGEDAYHPGRHPGNVRRRPNWRAPWGKHRTQAVAARAVPQCAPDQGKHMAAEALGTLCSSRGELPFPFGKATTFSKAGRHFLALHTFKRFEGALSRTRLCILHNS